MVQQPKATAAATFTSPLTRDDTLWPNIILASTNLFVVRASWLIPPNVKEATTPTFVKMEKTDKKTPPKLAAIPHTMVQNKMPQNKKSAEEMCGWEPQCSICTQSTPNIKAEDSEKDWNSNRQGTRKEDQLKRNYYPPSPKYSPSYNFPGRLSHHYKMGKRPKGKIRVFE